MDLYLNTYGSFIHKKDNMFEIGVEGKKTLISPSKVRSIVISTAVHLTSDVIKLALDNNIDIVMLDEFGNPYGRFWHVKFGSTAFIRRKQLEIFNKEEGLNLAVSWIINKIEHEINHLKELEYKRHSKVEMIETEIGEINEYVSKLRNVTGQLEERRNTIMAYEGNAAKHYYSILSHLIPEQFKFEGRSSQPAKDEFNCLLNYAFGILYSKVERALIIAGLDPFVGVLHTDNYNKKSFVFDFIENFRHLAVSTVFNLFSRKMVNKTYFDKIRGGLTLNKDGKRFLVEHFSEKLNKTIHYKGRNIVTLDTIQFDAHEVANMLIGKGELC